MAEKAKTCNPHLQSSFHITQNMNSILRLYKYIWKKYFCKKRKVEVLENGNISTNSGKSGKLFLYIAADSFFYTDLPSMIFLSGESTFLVNST